MLVKIGDCARHCSIGRQVDYLSKGNYGATAALADAISYHELCSIPIAVSSILARANTRSSESTVDLAGDESLEQWQSYLR